MLCDCVAWGANGRRTCHLVLIIRFTNACFWGGYLHDVYGNEQSCIVSRPSTSSYSGKSVCAC